MSQNFGIYDKGNFAGVDQGVDFTGSGLIPALGNGIVTDVGSSHIIEGGSYPVVIYRLTSGPYKGQYIYVAENFIPTVKVGDKLSLGKSIGRAKGSYPYTETGFNRQAKGWNPVAPLGSNPHGATSAGQQMLDYIDSLTGLKISGGGSVAGGGGGSSVTSIPGQIASQAGCIVPIAAMLSMVGFLSWAVIIHPF